MSFTACQVHFTNKSGKTMYASGPLLKKLNISSKKTVKLRLGTKAVRTPVKRLRKSGNHLYVPAGLRSAMRFPRKGISYIRNDAGGIKLGPLIGIMTSSSSRSLTRPFGTRTELIKTFLKAGSKKTFNFAFQPRDIHWNNDTVTAYFLDSNGNWKRKIVPLPDVVYNRLPSRKAEKSPYMMQIKERFVYRGIPVFNWSFFDKRDVYELLQHDPEAKRHLPETISNPTPEQLKALLQKHQFIYLKPTAGSLGIGIYRLTYHKNRGYFVRFRSNGRNTLLRFRRFSQLMKLLRRAKGSLSHYVAQQGVRLIELDRCPIDFRFHLNKNGKNEWVVGGIGAKKAGKGSVTTHVRTGGQVMSPTVALSRIYGETKGLNKLNEAKRTAIKLAQAIERNYQYRIGELGFDLGIDTEGHIWMFEANAKPGRSIYKHPALKADGKRTLALVYEHCMYLSRFRRMKEED